MHFNNFPPVRGYQKIQSIYQLDQSNRFRDIVGTYIHTSHVNTFEAIIYPSLIEKGKINSILYFIQEKGTKNMLFFFRN